MTDLINTAEPGSPELQVRVDRERASLAGLSRGQVAVPGAPRAGTRPHMVGWAGRPTRGLLEMDGSR